MNKKYDYPISDKLIEKLKEEYRQEAIDKGNTWRKDCTIAYLFDKLKEEYLEIEQAHNRDKTFAFFAYGYFEAELVDLILVASMLHERLKSLREMDDIPMIESDESP